MTATIYFCNYPPQAKCIALHNRKTLKLVRLLTWVSGILQMPPPTLQDKDTYYYLFNLNNAWNNSAANWAFKKKKLEKLHPPCPDRSKTLFTPSLPSKMSMVYLPLSFSVGSLIWSHSCSPVTPDLTLSEAAIFASLWEKKSSDQLIPDITGKVTVRRVMKKHVSRRSRSLREAFFFSII